MRTLAQFDRFAVSAPDRAGRLLHTFDFSAEPDYRVELGLPGAAPQRVLAIPRNGSNAVYPVMAGGTPWVSTEDSGSWNGVVHAFHALQGIFGNGFE